MRFSLLVKECQLIRITSPRVALLKVLLQLLDLLDLLARQRRIQPDVF
jgi:hypothetical protein